MEASRPLAKRPRDESPDDVMLINNRIPTGDGGRRVPQRGNAPRQVHYEQPEGRHMDRGNYQPSSSTSESRQQYGASRSRSEESLYYCQVHGMKIRSGAHPPCNTTSCNICIPCEMENIFRNSGLGRRCLQREQIYTTNGWNADNYTTSEPFEMNINADLPEGYELRKVHVRRLVNVETAIGNGDLNGISIEEYMLCKQWRGQPEENSRILYPNLIKGGNFIQYFWKRLENDSKTMRILRKAVELFGIPPPNQLCSRAFFVFVRLYGELVKNRLPRYLRDDQLERLFRTSMDLDEMHSHMITLKMEEEDYKNFPTTPQDRSVNTIIMEVLSTSPFRNELPNENFEELRKRFLKKLHMAIVLNRYLPILNGRQTQKLACHLGCFGSKITEIFNEIRFEDVGVPRYQLNQAELEDESQSEPDESEGSDNDDDVRVIDKYEHSQPQRQKQTVKGEGARGRIPERPRQQPSLPPQEAEDPIVVSSDDERGVPSRVGTKSPSEFSDEEFEEERRIRQREQRLRAAVQEPERPELKQPESELDRILKPFLDAEKRQTGYVPMPNPVRKIKLIDRTLLLPKVEGLPFGWTSYLPSQQKKTARGRRSSTCSTKRFT